MSSSHFSLIQGMEPRRLLAVTAPTVFQADFDFETTPHTVTIEFSADVGKSLNKADIELRNTTTGETVNGFQLDLTFDSDTNTAEVVYFVNQGILPDGRYQLEIDASGVSDEDGNLLDGDGNGEGGDNYTFDFFFLQGDANHDGVVNVGDLGILATNWQQDGQTFSGADLNYDGRVDVADLGILASQWQKTV